jgi:hypothetical protein
MPCTSIRLHACVGTHEQGGVSSSALAAQGDCTELHAMPLTLRKRAESSALH